MVVPMLSKAAEKMKEILFPRSHGRHGNGTQTVYCTLQMTPPTAVMENCSAMEYPVLRERAIFPGKPGTLPSESEAPS